MISPQKYKYETVLFSRQVVIIVGQTVWHNGGHALVEYVIHSGGAIFLPTAMIVNVHCMYGPYSNICVHILNVYKIS